MSLLLRPRRPGRARWVRRERREGRDRCPPARGRPLWHLPSTWAGGGSAGMRSLAGHPLYQPSFPFSGHLRQSFFLPLVAVPSLCGHSPPLPIPFFPPSRTVAMLMAPCLDGAAFEIIISGVTLSHFEGDTPHRNSSQYMGLERTAHQEQQHSTASAWTVASFRLRDSGCARAVGNEALVPHRVSQSRPKCPARP